MQLQTVYKVFNDLFYMDERGTDILDTLYGELVQNTFNEDIRDVLVKCVEDLSEGIYEVYATVSRAVGERMEELIKDYENAEDKQESELLDFIHPNNFKNLQGEFIPISEEEIKFLKDTIIELYTSEPYGANPDFYFNNVLDANVNWEMDVGDNAAEIIARLIRVCRESN